MTPDIAKIILAFLSRVDLKGNEAPTLMQVVSVLEEYANPTVPSNAKDSDVTPFMSSRA